MLVIKDEIEKADDCYLLLHSSNTGKCCIQKTILSEVCKEVINPFWNMKIAFKKGSWFQKITLVNEQFVNRSVWRNIIFKTEKCSIIHLVFLEFFKKKSRISVKWFQVSS